MQGGFVIFLKNKKTEAVKDLSHYRCYQNNFQNHAGAPRIQQHESILYTPVSAPTSISVIAWNSFFLCTCIPSYEEEIPQNSAN